MNVSSSDSLDGVLLLELFYYYFKFGNYMSNDDSRQNLVYYYSLQFSKFKFHTHKKNYDKRFCIFFFWNIVLHCKFFFLVAFKISTRYDLSSESGTTCNDRSTTMQKVFIDKKKQHIIFDFASLRIQTTRILKYITFVCSLYYVKDINNIIFKISLVFICLSGTLLFTINNLMIY